MKKESLDNVSIVLVAFKEFMKMFDGHHNARQSQEETQASRKYQIKIGNSAQTYGLPPPSNS